MRTNYAEYIEVRKTLNICKEIFNQYEWLTDAYVSDFYTAHHWKKLPSCWRKIFQTVELENIANIINFNEPLHNFQVLPLSLLSLRELLRHLHIPRKQVTDIQIDYNKNNHAVSGDIFSNSCLNNMFQKQVKLKKRHEIELMSKICYKLATETKCSYIIDVGSGLGHLSRMLAYKYGLKVFSLEAQEYLTKQARKLDQQLENMLKRTHNQHMLINSKPIHISMKVETNSDGHDIVETIKEYLGDKFYNTQFGIVGLHPCGNLGATLLRCFSQFAQIQFVNVVGCCYMKLTNELTPEYNSGFPLSKFGRDHHFKLNYCSLEVACHALEAYCQKLTNGECWQLKVHAYRAALEKLIVAKWPDKYHSQICSVKCTKDFPFLEYCNKAVSKLQLQLSETEIHSEDIKRDLEKWKDVVTFYSLRLMLAPLIETIILLDRLLFILESGNHCYVTSAFDPLISPRNQIMTGIKMHPG